MKTLPLPDTHPLKMGKKWQKRQYLIIIIKNKENGKMEQVEEKAWSIYQSNQRAHFVFNHDRVTWACRIPKKRIENFKQFKELVRLEGILTGTLDLKSVSNTDEGYFYNFEFTSKYNDEFSRKISFPVLKLKSMHCFRSFISHKTVGVLFSGTQKDFNFMQDEWFEMAERILSCE